MKISSVFSIAYTVATDFNKLSSPLLARNWQHLVNFDHPQPRRHTQVSNGFSSGCASMEGNNNRLIVPFSKVIRTESSRGTSKRGSVDSTYSSRPKQET